MSSQIWFSDYVYVHVEFKVKNKATVVYSIEMMHRQSVRAERNSTQKHVENRQSRCGVKSGVTKKTTSAERPCRRSHSLYIGPMHRFGIGNKNDCQEGNRLRFTTTENVQNMEHVCTNWRPFVSTRCLNQVAFDRDSACVWDMTTARSRVVVLSTCTGT